MNLIERPTIPAHVAEFRMAFREMEIKPTYPGWGHLALTCFGSLAAIIFSVSRVHDVQPGEWLTLPLAFLFANMSEYLGHRIPMHHPKPGLRALFQRHTLQHHRFYTNEAMSYESPSDLKITLFPPLMFLFFFGGIATPFGLLVFLLSTANIGWLFIATIMSYFLFYELCHFSFHTPKGLWVGKIPGVSFLRRHHMLHHDPALMSRWNFNLTIPISDLLFGTYYTPPSDPPE